MADVALRLIEIVALGITVAAIAIGNVIQSIQSGEVSSRSVKSGIIKFIKYCILVAICLGLVFLLSLARIIETTHSPLVALSLTFLGVATGFAGLVAEKIPSLLYELNIAQGASSNEFSRGYRNRVAIIVFLWLSGAAISYFNISWPYDEVILFQNILYISMVIITASLISHVSNLENNEQDMKITDYVNR
jgi:magnesium-transporting ATPase (P-type)